MEMRRGEDSSMSTGAEIQPGVEPEGSSPALETAEAHREAVRVKIAEYIERETRPALEKFQNRGVEISNRIAENYEQNKLISGQDISELSSLCEEFSVYVTADTTAIFQRALSQIDDPVIQLVESVSRHNFTHICQPMEAYLKELYEFDGDLYLHRDEESLESLGDIPVYKPVDLETFSFGRETYIRFEPSDLSEMVRNQVAAPEDLARIDFQVDTPDSQIVVINEKSLFAEIVRDLIDNAVAAMPQGGKLEVKLEQEGDEAVLTISDSGAGISAENLDRVQEAGFSTRGTSGMGLALAKRYFETFLGGKFTIESHTGENHGTKITIKLPIVISEGKAV